MKRFVYKVREVMALLQAGGEHTLVVCSFDARRPEKSGKRVTLKKVAYSSHNGYKLCTVRYRSGQPESFHPCLVEIFNGTTVTP